MDAISMHSSKTIYQSVLPPFKKVTIQDTAYFDLNSLQSYDVMPQIDPTDSLQTLGIFKELKRSSEGELSIIYDQTLAPEGYQLIIGKHLIIKASTKAGSFYGMLALYKLSLLGVKLPYAKIENTPDIEERGLHLDVGRKYFSKEWIFKLLEEMAFSQLNTLQFHFSENKGFRIACEMYPEIVSEDHLSKNDVYEIIEYARKLHIQIIPSLDSPGHLHYALKHFPSFQLEGSDGGSLDISQEKAREWVYQLYEEYAELFKDSHYFNIGGDEFVDFDQFDSFEPLCDYAKNQLGLQDAHAVDTYHDYLNELAMLLEDKGFTVRVWNDGLYRKNQQPNIQLKESIQICYWTRYHKNMADVETFVEKGHELVNFHAENFYYVLHVDVGVKRVDPKAWFETWESKIFSFGQRLKDESKLKGSSYSIWCDAPEIATEKRIFHDIQEPLWAFACKTWMNEGLMTYDHFKNIYVEYLDK